jgi:diguanylate cyclase (GGDEF)-like protein
VGRYGGEEFLVLFPGCDSENSANQAERLRRAIVDTPIMHGNVAISMTASFGVTVWVAGQKPESLVQTADEALYKAKNAGRNRVEILMPRVAVLESDLVESTVDTIP